MSRSGKYYQRVTFYHDWIGRFLAQVIHFATDADVGITSHQARVWVINPDLLFESFYKYEIADGFKNPTEINVNIPTNI
jgi:hypothetical protein